MFVSDLSLAALLGWWAKEGLFSSRPYLILSLAAGVLNTPLLCFFSHPERLDDYLMMHFYLCALNVLLALWRIYRAKGKAGQDKA